jgi:hypothetical protein
LGIRVFQFVLWLVMSWCVTTFTHEAGHLVGGWIGGGTFRTANLLPWTLPYSIFDPDPHPLITLWSGPILGVLVPLGFAFIIQRNWMWFIADFAMLANGAYIATAWWSGESHLDTPKLLEHGAHPLTIGLYCALTIGFGYIRFRRSCLRLLFPPDHDTDAVSN